MDQSTPLAKAYVLTATYNAPGFCSTADGVALGGLASEVRLPLGSDADALLSMRSRAEELLSTLSRDRVLLVG